MMKTILSKPLIRHCMLSVLWLLFSFLFVTQTSAQLPTATQVASQMSVGWNLGNSMEVPGDETGWGNPATSQQLVNQVKAAGFNTLRIPCAWDSYANQSNNQISATWLARVKQVVDYAISQGMFVVLNSHWDGGWLEEHPLYAYQQAVNVKQNAYWTQIANYFINYDEHLLFAGTNEVRADYNTPTSEHITVQQSYNQTFVNAVRATGGNNATRSLIVQTYNTNAWHGLDYFSLPSDPASGRLLVEVHYYDPYGFALDTDNSTACTVWGQPWSGGNVCSWGQEAYVDDLFNQMQQRWVNNGVPVIIGEFGAVKRTSLSGSALSDHLASRNYFLEYITAAAHDRGMVPVYWDNGYAGDMGFALFNRSSGAVVDQDAIDALMNGVGGVVTTPTATYYQIQNRATGLYLDGIGRTANGDLVGMWANTNHVNSHWELVDMGSGYYRLKNRGTGLYLDGYGRTANGSDVSQYANTTHYNAQWSLEQYSGEYYRLRNRATSLYLDGMGRTANGDNVGQWANTTHQNAQWRLVAVSSSSREVSELKPENEFVIYPNPMVTEQFTLRQNAGIQSELRIFNQTGQVVQAAICSEKEQTIYVGDLNSGVYLVKILSDQGVAVHKLIKQ